MSLDSRVISPCHGKHCNLKQGHCTDCGRTMAEILEWTSATADRKREIKAAAAQRLARQTAESQ